MLLCTQTLTNTFYYLEMHTFICNLNRNACPKLAVNISLQFIFTEKKKVFVDRMSGNSLTT